MGWRLAERPPRPDPLTPEMREFLEHERKLRRARKKAANKAKKAAEEAAQAPLTQKEQKRMQDIDTSSKKRHVDDDFATFEELVR